MTPSASASVFRWSSRVVRAAGPSSSRASSNACCRAAVGDAELVGELVERGAEAGAAAVAGAARAAAAEAGGRAVAVEELDLAAADWASALPSPLWLPIA